MKMKNYFQPNAPDSGPWRYDSRLDCWVEPDLATSIDWENWPVRKSDEKTTDIFFIDGFPRQATNTLRRLILECFPTIAITADIQHMEYPFFASTNRGDKCIITLRDPLEAISSTYGYTKAKINNEDILQSIIRYYIRITSSPSRIENVSVVDFEDIVNNPYRLLLRLKNKFYIEKSNIDNYVEVKNTKTYDQNHNFTQKQEVVNYLKENISKLSECYNVYRQVIKEKI